MWLGRSSLGGRCSPAQSCNPVPAKFVVIVFTALVQHMKHISTAIGFACRATQHKRAEGKPLPDNLLVRMNDVSTLSSIPSIPCSMSVMPLAADMKSTLT